MGLTVIACGIMKEELEQFQNNRLSFVFLEQSLHLTPEKMREAIQTEIYKAEQESAEGILLGYGLCSNGIVGLTSNRLPLIIPRVHDCIALFLGSASRYLEEHQREPGTYYLTRGWIEEGKSPLGTYAEYCKRYKQEMAEWAIREELKNYKRIALIDTGFRITEAQREHGRENARFFKLQYEELKGSLAFFERMVGGSWEQDFIILKPGEEVKQHLFLDL
jgi:hypothetical protein